ncbi:YidC/Oxa1 family membrane protein insertase [Streptococcus sp. DD13]|uniref:YidC/Oxa1 family membrane protein insertase n=1 Tax=Streptococcus sp. DD13 TaxID=1777881 RepID=UPI000791F9ED|nr:YidC/Oxa1 family membrane protein insertase [Streptococcus sp. DD13]KXT77691.1 Inner membrane protein translocase component YidC [Streptococcus sp. DD13]
MKKNVKWIGILSLSLLLLTACGTSEVTSQSTGWWDQLIYWIGQSIEALSFGNIGIGIILFTVILRTVLLPIYQMQMNSSRKMQEIQPQIKELQQRYSGRDWETRAKLTEETQRLQKENGVNMYATLIPLAVQMPILIALFQALTRIEALKVGHFLWLNIAEPDPYLILPFLAAFFTFYSTYLTNKAAPERSTAMTVMALVLPVIIFFSARSFASGVSLYWAVSYAYQVVQTLLFNNPYKIVAEREAVKRAEKERVSKQRKAKLKAQKRK